MSFLALLVPPLNHLLAQSAWAPPLLRTQQGKTLALSGGRLSLCLKISADGFFVATVSESPDVRITLPADAPARWLLDRASILSLAHIEGQAEVAETLAKVFRDLRWNPEADLAPVTGDLLAHRIVSIAGSVNAQLEARGRRLIANVSEYTIQERRALVTAPANVQLSTEITAVQERLSKLEARLSALDC